MNNERYYQIIDEAYENYSKEYEKDNSIGMTLLVQRVDGKSVYRKPDREMFVTMCTYDKAFSERWGLKIEERKLTWEEQVQWVMKNTDVEWENLYIVEEIAKESTPKRLLTVIYKDETIEVYE